MPSPKEQVDAARSAVLAVPAPNLGCLVVSGKDRVSWLNGLVTCDLSQWGGADERAPYALVVSRSGRILADPILVAAGEKTLAVVDRALIEILRAHLDHYLVMEDAEVAPGVDAFETWLLHGPKAYDVLGAARTAGAVGGAIDPTGLGGAIIVAPSEQAAAVRAVVESAVLGAGGVLGDGAGWEALRLECGVPRIGVDFDDKTYPQEASLEKAAVSFSKGCYLGQEVVCMLEMRGHVKRKLVSIVLDAGQGSAPGAPPFEAGFTISDETGTAVGELTSVAMSPTLGQPVGLAMIKRAHAVEGAQVTLAGIRAKVVARPA